jgi:hypothetical protein
MNYAIRGFHTNEYINKKTINITAHIFFTE